MVVCAATDVHARILVVRCAACHKGHLTCVKALVKADLDPPVDLYACTEVGFQTAAHCRQPSRFIVRCCLRPCSVNAACRGFVPALPFAFWLSGAITIVRCPALTGLLAERRYERLPCSRGKARRCENLCSTPFLGIPMSRRASLLRLQTPFAAFLCIPLRWRAVQIGSRIPLSWLLSRLDRRALCLLLCLIVVLVCSPCIAISSLCCSAAALSATAQVLRFLLAETDLQLSKTDPVSHLPIRMQSTCFAFAVNRALALRFELSAATHFFDRSRFKARFVLAHPIWLFALGCFRRRTCAAGWRRSAATFRLSSESCLCPALRTALPSRRLSCSLEGSGVVAVVLLPGRCAGCCRVRVVCVCLIDRPRPSALPPRCEHWFRMQDADRAGQGGPSVPDAGAEAGGGHHSRYERGCVVVRFEPGFLVDVGLTLLACRSIPILARLLCVSWLPRQSFSSTEDPPLPSLHEAASKGHLHIVQ